MLADLRTSQDKASAIIKGLKYSETKFDQLKSKQRDKMYSYLTNHHNSCRSIDNLLTPLPVKKATVAETPEHFMLKNFDY